MGRLRMGIPSKAPVVQRLAPSRFHRPARPFVTPAAGPAEVPDLTVQMRRAESFGHRFMPSSGGGAARAMPREVRSRMERAFGADFSKVTIREGGQAPALGAVAFTRGESVHFAPGTFRPHTLEGQKLLGHELAHVLQQRKGQVRPTTRVQGVPVNLDGKLETEADAVGGRAARGIPLGRNWNGAGIPAAAVGEPVAQGLFEWLWNLRPWGKSSQPEEEEEKLKGADLELPKVPLGERPDKPDRLKGKKDSRGNPLTASHKYPWNKIKADANKVISGTKDPENLGQWARREDPSKVGKRGLAWTPHNIFFTPLPEHRADDPHEELDTHFTKSGSVTPRSELALDIEHSGGINAFDPEELASRLEELSQKKLLDFSGYESDEWEGPPKARYQKGQPKSWRSWSSKRKVEYARKHSKRKKGQGTA